MLYRHFERRHGLTHEVPARTFWVLRILTWVRTVYMFISAVIFGFAIVKGEAFLAVAALTFLGASLAMKRVGERMKRAESEWNEN
jgi:predicted membrane-bound mannosyltransferase